MAAITQSPGIEQSPALFRRRANTVFWLMWSLNFLNYADRYAFTAVSPVVAKEFHFDYATLGFITGSAFLLTYTLGILPLGLLADRIKRKNVIGSGVLFWSLMTFLTGLVRSPASLTAVRAALGLGEGSYYPPGTSLLSSYYPTERRARVMSRWGMGSLVGLAAGFLVGGIIAQLFGWRYAFFIFGVPGIVLAAITWRMKEPPRVAQDDNDIPELALARAGWQGIKRDVADLLKVPTLRVTVAVQAMGFFVLFASVTFLPTLLNQQFGLSTGTIGLISGVVLVIGGVGGLYLGALFADKLITRFPGARVFVSGMGFLLAAPFFAGAIFAAIATTGLPLNVRLYGLFIPLFLLTAVLLNVYSGPLTAVVQDVTAPARRAAAIGLTLMLSHLLGDLASPYLVGKLGDTLKSGAQNASWIAQLGVTPANALGVAFLITCVPLLIIAGIVGIRGARAVKSDAEKAQLVEAA